MGESDKTFMVMCLWSCFSRSGASHFISSFPPCTYTHTHPTTPHKSSYKHLHTPPPPPPPPPPHTHTHTHTQGDAAIPPLDALHMSELSIEYQSALEREKELAKRYEDLFNFLQMHVKDSQVSSHMTTTIHTDWQSHDNYSTC